MSRNHPWERGSSVPLAELRAASRLDSMDSGGSYVDASDGRPGRPALPGGVQADEPAELGSGVDPAGLWSSFIFFRPVLSSPLVCTSVATRRAANDEKPPTFRGTRSKSRLPLCLTGPAGLDPMRERGTLCVPTEREGKSESGLQPTVWEFSPVFSCGCVWFDPPIFPEKNNGTFLRLTPSGCVFLRAYGPRT